MLTGLLEPSAGHIRVHGRDVRGDLKSYQRRIGYEDSGMFEAVDAVRGKTLWQFQTNQTWKASRMTYVFDGKQYVAVAAGTNIIAFGL
jgi:ABC-type uncharacterized transport system ATPase subunit